MVAETKYYELLGISTTAGSEDIKKAYRKLSLRWHPDKNPTNREEAEEKFKLLAEAYSVLSDAEMRAKYDQYGEAGLRRNFQPGQQQQSYQQHSYNPHAGSGGGDFGFRFRSAHDIFRDFFGGQDPFASMFSMNTFADPFADPFFSQHAGPSGLRGNAGGGSNNGGGSVAVGGFGGFGFGGFPSMMFASPFGDGSALPASGSFSFVSSSTIGGAGGLRGPSGPSTRTSIQVVNGVKMQTIEENDGHGNVTVTRIDPSGYKEVSVNGVPQQSRTSPRKNIDEGHSRQKQQQQQYSQASSQRRNSAEHYSHAPTSPPKSARADSFNRYSAAKEAAYSGSDSDSIVEVEIIEVDSNNSSKGVESKSSDHPKFPVNLPSAADSTTASKAGVAATATKTTSARTEAPASAAAAAPKKPIVHDMPSPPTTEPNTKRHEAEARYDQQQQQQQRTRANNYADSVPLSAPVNRPSGPRASGHTPHQQYAPQTQPQYQQQYQAQYQPQPPQQQAYTQNQPQYQRQQRYDYQEPNGGLNASMRAAPRNEGEDILAAARNKLRATGNGGNIAAMDERRPHMGVKEALKATGASILKARPRMNRSSSAPKVPLEQPGQPVPETRAYAPIHRPPPPNVAEPSRNAYAPPPPAQHYVSVQSTMTGRAAPGHKPPRSRDRMRSTLHYENFTAPSVQHASYATLSSQPPMPQQPVDARAPTPGYAYLQHRPTTQPTTHYQGQATYVDPSAGSGYVSSQSAAGPVSGSRRQYDDQPLSATQAKNQQQQQQQPMDTGISGPSMYATNQHASVHTGATHSGSAAGYQ
ncbi:DnaJ sub B member 6 [Coemansia sp. RSA 2603]|nr:DnaJ sub B member 6 [Coemansia sp. RSA 2603]